MSSEKEKFAELVKKHLTDTKSLENALRIKSDELDVANQLITRQNDEREKRAAELVIANIELVIQSEEKAKRAADLAIANIELVFQSEEKAKRAAELLIANIELSFQGEEKQKRAAELVIANVELAFQETEKQKRAAELIIANVELAFQVKEKGSRATELIELNLQHESQNQEKENKVNEMIIVNRELKHFAFVASHDLQHPLRTVSNYMNLFEMRYVKDLDEDAQKYIKSVKDVTARMSNLIQSLLDYSHIGHNKASSFTDIKSIISEVVEDLDTLIKSTGTVVSVGEMPSLKVYKSELGQLFQNLISNAIKFRNPDHKPHVQVSSEEIDGEWIFSIKDNGIGIEEKYQEKIFDIFERLHSHKEYEGSGIGLANCRKIIELHHGEIKVESLPGQGARFYFNIPGEKKK